ncbi:hypothetical protein CYMTET_45351 [Cymbomonas tetramitiformis]|uniref:Acyltransferase n=1 Tax=Cymbomonas tetramitiformis TaxID=36881 RepID=A0AAE0C056_9CHLO|nr:hypothetical protein CYMTET_45351 [Cymbomonas tetramitiformis]|eukprot:gene5116-6223_t
MTEGVECTQNYASAVSSTGVMTLRFGRSTRVAGIFAQTFCALIFATYFFYWLYALIIAAMLIWTGLMSVNVFAACTVAYFTSLFIYKPQNGKGWPFHWFLYSSFTDAVLGYHDSTVIREAELDTSRKYMFAMSPHGVFGVCRAFSGGAKAWKRMFPGVSARWGSFGGAFFFPGVREFSLSVGCLDASRPVLKKAMKRGENIILLPGGITEMSLTDGNSKETLLTQSNRKGFVKIAIEGGMDVVPGFCFGEKWVHDTVQLPLVVRNFLYKNLRLGGTFIKGRYGTFLGKIADTNGKSLSLGYVWGKPIPVTKMDEPTQDYIDEIHAKYMAAILDIFERYKSRFGYSDEETLKFVPSGYQPNKEK